MNTLTATDLQLEFTSLFLFEDDRLTISQKATLQDFRTLGKTIKNWEQKMDIYKSDFVREATTRFQPQEWTQLFADLRFDNNSMTSACRLAALLPDQRRLDVLSQEHHDEICRHQMSKEEQNSWLQRAIDSKVDPQILRANLKMWNAEKRPAVWRMRGTNEVCDIQGRSAPVVTIQGILLEYGKWEDKNSPFWQNQSAQDWKNIANLLRRPALMYRRACLEAQKGGVV